MPMSVSASTPRFGCATSNVNSPVAIVCTHAFPVASAVPVSSAHNTAATASWVRTSSRNGARRPAASNCKVQSQPVETGAPSTSESSSAQRATGRCWRSIRYTANARTSGPQHIGARAAAGNTPALSCPHAQRRRSTTCSLTCTRAGIRSMTWRTSVPTTTAVSMPVPHPPQHNGPCTIVTSGSRRRRDVPGVPGCLPGLRPAARASARRSARFLRGPTPSDDGGFELFEESCPAAFSNTAIRAACTSTISRNDTIKPACSTTSRSRYPAR